MLCHTANFFLYTFLINKWVLLHVNSLWCKAGVLCIQMYGYPSCLLLHFNTLYRMLILWLNVDTFISSKKINWLEWIKWTKDRPWHTVSIVIGMAKAHADGNNIYFQKAIYVHSGISSRSVPLGRQAGRWKHDLMPIF